MELKSLFGRIGNERRRGLTRFIVPHPSFNWYMRGVCIGAMVTAGFVGLATWWYHRSLLDALGLFDLLRHPDFHEVMAYYTRITVLTTGIGVLASAMFVVMFSVYLFHKIVGPVYRLKQHMSGIVAGDPVRALHFRDGDQLTDVCDTYNALLHSLELIESKPLEEAEAAPPAGESPADAEA